MQLFKIGETNFTSFITVPSYKVNKNDVYMSWTDANHKQHRFLTRRQVSGSFSMLFDSVTDYNLFLSTIESKKNREGYIPNCRVYCNNTNTVENVDLFIDFEVADILPVIGTSDNESFEVTITER